jgi:hypothetical protein
MDARETPDTYFSVGWSSGQKQGELIDMKSRVFRGLMALAAPTLLVAGAATWASAAPLHRLSAEFQNSTNIGGSGEISTTATPADGGLPVYQKTLSVPFDVA